MNLPVFSDITNIISRVRHPIGTVAFNMKPVRGPWGGSSTFVTQLSSYLLRRGYRVVFSLDESVDVAVIIDPRLDAANRMFGIDDIAEMRERNPRLRVLHRVNECDQRKGTDFMDPLLEKASAVVDHTVFIAEWLRDYHAKRWYDTARSNTVIYNGADPRFFHPLGSMKWDGQEPLRFVTHHWSDNMLKGFAEYQQLDNAIANGEIKGVEFAIVGRWPASIDWKTAKTVAPLHGKRLAQELKKYHVYITASRWEPCGMHHVEGAQCGLPLLYHRDGGGIVEAGQRYGLGFGDNLVEQVNLIKEQYFELRKKVLDNAPSGDRMTLGFANIIQRLITEASG